VHENIYAEMFKVLLSAFVIMELFMMSFGDSSVLIRQWNTTSPFWRVYGISRKAHDDSSKTIGAQDASSSWISSMRSRPTIIQTPMAHAFIQYLFDQTYPTRGSEACSCVGRDCSTMLNSRMCSPTSRDTVLKIVRVSTDFNPTHNLTTLKYTDVLVTTYSIVDEFAPSYKIKISLPFGSFSFIGRKSHVPQDLIYSRDIQTKKKFCIYSFNSNEDRELSRQIGKYDGPVMFGTDLGTKFIAELGERLLKYNMNESIDSLTSSIESYKNGIPRLYDDSVKQMEDYRFVIAFEFSDFRNYTSDKIVNAFLAKSVPIYWGSDEIDLYFNRRAFINVKDYSTFSECLDYIFKVHHDEELYNQYRREPPMSVMQYKAFFKWHSSVRDETTMKMIRNGLDELLTSRPHFRRRKRTISGLKKAGLKRKSKKSKYTFPSWS
jgi:hypothetical protein